MISPKAPAAERQPEREDRLNIARALFKALAAQYPEKSIILCDGDGLMVGHTHDAPSAPYRHSR